MLIFTENINTKKIYGLIHIPKNSGRYMRTQISNKFIITNKINDLTIVNTEIKNNLFFVPCHNDGDIVLPAHTSYHQFKKYNINIDIFFAFTRNPYDRFISGYLYCLELNILKLVLKSIKLTYNIHFVINEEEEYKLPQLIKGWAKTIVNDPVDYVQFKLISSTQIISVGHPFKYPLNMSQFTNESDVIVQVSKNSESLISKIIDYSWTINRFLLKLIGSTYLFSIAILFLILFMISLTKTKFNLKKDIIVFLFISHMFNLAILSISYVSDEARYVFPIIYISYLILINDIKLKTKDGNGPKDFS
jgi:hypothetical protein